MCGFFFQAEDGIRDLVRSRGLGDVYKRQVVSRWSFVGGGLWSAVSAQRCRPRGWRSRAGLQTCVLYTSDAADDLLCVDLGGRRIIKKKKKHKKTKNKKQKGDKDITY